MSDVPSFLQETPLPEEPEVSAEPVAEVITGEPEPAPAPPAAAPQEDKHVPLPALLDERDKRKAVEAERDQLLRWKAEQEARAAQTPPEFFNDPDQRLQFERQQMQGALLNVKLEQSRFLAEREFSKEEVEKAVQWFNDYPELSRRMLNEPSPFHAAVETYRQFSAAKRFGPDPDAWINSEVEKRLAERIAQQPVQPTPPSPPKSLAAAPSAGANRAPVRSGWDQLFGTG